MMKYDYENEREYWEAKDGTKLVVGTAGSLIMVCMTCGEEHFRERISEHESCGDCILGKPNAIRADLHSEKDFHCKTSRPCSQRA